MPPLLRPTSGIPWPWPVSWPPTVRLSSRRSLIPAIWVPPHHVRELRGLVAHRKRLVSQRSAAKNRLHSLLHRHNILPAGGDIFSTHSHNWWDSLPISHTEKLRARQDLAVIGHLSPLIGEVETELARLSVSEAWADQVTYLIQLPSIGLLTAMTILGAIGDISRFSTAKKLVGYGGLGARIHASGQVRRSGGITKQGRRELRAAMIEAAWAAVRTHPHWKAQFRRLEKRIGKLKAIVATVRKLLVVVWHVLTHQVADRYANPHAVARKLMTWGSRHGTAAQQACPQPPSCATIWTGSDWLLIWRPSLTADAQCASHRHRRSRRGSHPQPIET